MANPNTSIYTGSGPKLTENSESQLSNLGSMSSSDLFGGSTYSPFTGAGTYTPTSTPAVDQSSGQISPSIWDNLDLSSFSSPQQPSPAAAGGAGANTAGLSGLSSLLPYLGAGGLGLYQTKQAQNEASGQSAQIAALGTPFTNQALQQLGQFNSGQLRPDQQNVLNTANQVGSEIAASATPLGQLAQQAFADYNAGKLPAADEQKLQDQVASQKQQVRQMLASQGITDSSVLSAHDQQIDNQAMQARQDLLDKRFATGDQAYNQWLNSTTQGAQLKLDGQKFASTSFEEMLNNAIGLGNEGMLPAMTAMQMMISSNSQLSQQVNQLLGNLASAYSYSASGQANGGGGGSGSNITARLGQIINGVKTGTGKVGNAVSTWYDQNTISSDWGSGANANSALSDAGFGGSSADVVAGFDPNSDFSGAGGQAAANTATGGAAVAQQPSGLATANHYAGEAGNVLGIYTGIQQGGVQGYGGAAVNAAALGSKAGLFSSGVGAAAGYVAAPLAVYGAIEGYQSGDTAGDTIRGAEAGAAIGSVVPVIGTAIGAVVGAVVGAISSAFGPGKKSAGQSAWEWYQSSGAMKENGNQLSTSQFEESWLGAWQSDNNRKYLDTFTKMSGSGSHGGDAEVFKGWIEDQLASGIKSGTITKGQSSADIYAKVITPAMDQYWKQTGSQMTSAQWQQRASQGKLQLPQMIQATIDRAMTGGQIGRVGENYDGVSGWGADRKKQEYVPTLTELLGVHA